MFSEEERKLWRVAVALGSAAWLVLLVGGVYEVLHLLALAVLPKDAFIIWSAQIAGALWQMLWVWAAYLLLRGASLSLRVIIEIRQNVVSQEEQGEREDVL